MADQLRDRIAAALSVAGAFCGGCGFEPGETGCSDCVRVRGMYTDAELAVVQPELDRLQAELATAGQQLSAIAALAGRWDNALAVDKPYARALRSALTAQES